MPLGDRETFYAPYDDVRDDKKDTVWASFEYDNKTLKVGETGTVYNDILAKCSPDVVLYIFARVETGDELSKRAKFVLISWVGSDVGVMKRSRAGTDKADIRSVIRDVAIEVMADQLDELDYALIVEQCKKAGGANYGSDKGISDSEKRAYNPSKFG